MQKEEDFLDRIGDLAEKHRSGDSLLPDRGPKDLSSIALSDFPEVELTLQTDQKIKELNDIVRSIENKTSENKEVILKDGYKINYRSELNRAQLAAVASINGPVLVIAGAGSGKTRVIVHRVAFMLENGIDPDEILLTDIYKKSRQRDAQPGSGSSAE